MLVAGWLRVVHRLAAPLARRRVPPAFLTAAGVGAAVAVPGVVALRGRWPAAGAGLAVSAAVLDGLDGAVARATGTATDRGRSLDHLADRTADLALLVALGLLRGPAWVSAALTVRRRRRSPPVPMP